ncbi:BCCT family transporter [Vibrio palustris]|uniref:Glycine betaine transporter BetL n=1 Tax=Vibrio palustris TaxID=1918946 RepID=A0A1R4B6W3_9VIBR|nr:BCCT family transporter [Vibrio palustris]SJL84667.1 Glycine betaine transporter BetL [Vibrio palustris]
MPDVFKKYSIETTDYEVGQDNIQKWGFDVHNAVFGISASLIIVFLIAVLVADPATAKDTLSTIKNTIIEDADSFFMWAMNAFLVFGLILMVSPFGKIKIGGREATPDHSTFSWLSMLFSAGMGTALLFWGVAEPTAYYTDWYGTPLDVTPFTPEAKALALGTTIYHWGIHGWSMFGLVALSLAFFHFNKGLPLSMRSVFYPIFGDRAWGWLGHIVDIVAVLATLFGLATSLGLGAQQASSGINYTLGTHAGMWLDMVVIAVVTAISVLSVMKGIDGGVKRLSNFNMIFAFALLAFVIVACWGTVWSSLTNSFMGYVENIIPLSNPYGRTDEKWMHAWTLFYWAWWISWSPFVGMFIARISRGRSVRTFMLAVTFIPTIVTLIYMGIFGGVAIDQVANHIGVLGEKGITDISMTLFYMYDNIPYGNVISIISIALILVFFITSSDSGSLVIDSITAGGKVDSPIPQRVFWASMEGAIAATMLWVGGKDALQALQSGVVATALPFTFVLIIMCMSLLMGLKSEYSVYKKIPLVQN